jgi:hypothetical protein
MHAPQATDNAAAAGRPDLATAATARQERRTRWDVGVITVLSEETSAVAAMLGASGASRVQVHDSGLRCREACLGNADSGI